MISIIPDSLCSNICKTLQQFWLKCLLGCLCLGGMGNLSAQCPKLTVDIGSTSLQICSDNQYFVYYCNEGEAIAENVRIGVEFPEPLTFKEADLPVEREDNVYFFDIGALEVGQCGDFAIDVAVVCDVLVGKTACVIANISPNDPCDPPSELWDRSTIEVTGECVDGQIKFTISNTGEGNMSENSQYRIYEDDIFVSTGTKFQIASGESFDVLRPMTGRTISLEADQSAFHPHPDMPKATVEACGEPPFSLGMIDKFPQNDQLPFRDYDCQQIVTSIAGTEKLISPSGAQADKIIPGYAQLTYKIRFQNDGAETVNKLIIRDVLSPSLDLNSLQLGASSHPYIFEQDTTNALIWTFENINLPSSEVDLEGSQGFVQFKIHLINKELFDIQIDNQASIRFDDSLPLFTNTVFHFTGDLTLDLDNLTIDFDSQAVNVYPIPARGNLHFVLQSAKAYLNRGNWEIDIYNLLGVKIKSIPMNQRHTRMDIGDVNKGMYMYRIRDDRGGLIQSGKIYVDR